MQHAVGVPQPTTRRRIPGGAAVAAGALWALVWWRHVDQWANPEPFIYHPDGLTFAALGTVVVGLVFLVAALALRLPQGALTVLTMGVLVWAAVSLARAGLALATWAPGPVGCAAILALAGAAAGSLTHRLLHSGESVRTWGIAALVLTLAGTLIPGLEVVRARGQITVLRASERSFVLPQPPGFVARYVGPDLLYPYLELTRGSGDTMEEVFILSDKPAGGEVCAPHPRFALTGCQADGTGFTLTADGNVTVAEMRGTTRLLAYFSSSALSPDTVRSWLREAPVVTPSELIDATYGQTQVSASAIRP